MRLVRRLRPAVPLAALLLSWAVARTGAGAPAVPVTRNPPPLPRVLQQADSLFGAGDRDGAARIAEQQLAIARGRQDRGLELSARLARASFLQRSGDAPGSLPDLEWSLRAAPALRDSFAWARALMMWGYVRGVQASPADAIMAQRQSLLLSRALGDLRGEGMAWARVGDAMVNLGDYAGAIRELNGALATLERWRATLAPADSLVRHRFDGNIAGSYLSLGDAYVNLGRLDSAAAPYDRAARLAAPLNRPEVTSLVLTAQANLEDVAGNPELASRRFLEAYRLGMQAGLPNVGGTGGINYAGKLIEMRRFDEATALLDTLARVLHRAGDLDYEGVCYTLTGDARMGQGRPAEALAWYRRALALGDDLPVDGMSLARLGLSEALFALDSVSAARAVLEEPAGARLRADCIADRAIRWDLQLARLHAASGDDRGALALARRADALAAGMAQPPLRTRTLTRLALALRGTGSEELSRATLAQAAAQWEQTRAMPGQADWRERWGGASDLAVVTATLVLGDSAAGGPRAAEAFEAVQRFKSRTLDERIRGIEGARRSVPATLAAVQAVLRPGEVLLDAHVGADRSWLFAVTRATCEVAPLSGERELGSRARSLRQLVSEPGRGASAVPPAALARSAESVTEWLLGPLLSRVAGASSVIVSPDGPLSLLPLAALRLPGAGGAPEWLGLSRDLAVTPSVALWLASRGAPRGEAGRNPALVSFAASVDTAGLALPGAVREARALSRAVRGVQVRVDLPVPDSAAWRGADVLHFASHAFVDDQHPWRSGLLLSPEGDGVFLRAGDIAAGRLKARLVVLSACGTAGGQVITGEGVLGLGSAFLVAGAPTIVATQWPVDDEASRRWSREFYAKLSRGSTVNQALRAARRSLAGRAATSSPAYWAPYVLIGDGGETLPLRRRWSTGSAAATVAVLAAVFAAMTPGLRRKARS